MASSALTARIIMLNSRLRGGGTDTQCLALAQGLVAQGWEVETAGPESAPLAGKAPALQSLPKLRPLQIFTLAGLLKRSRARIVHAHHGDDYWTALLASRLIQPRPLVVFSRHLAKSPRSTLSRKQLFANADAVIAVSRFVAQVLLEGHRDPASSVAERHHRPPCRLDPRKLHVIHTGIDTKRFLPRERAFTDSTRRALGLPPGDTVFGVVGGFDLPVGKGQRVLVRAARDVVRRLPRSKFLLAGTGTLEPTLKEDIRHHGLEGRVLLVGQHSDPLALHHALDILVHPQIATEAFPSVVLEAHACGRPVIASRLDGIPEAWSIGGLGHLVPPGDAPELAATMIGQAEQAAPSEPERATAHARVEAEASLPVQARKVADLYRRLMAFKA
ncbi:MAG: glycosyltransferase family 1 protein [Verrucomicrobia bacterium]|nr:glycosyltransferase family 1 protein [Verrucomicrobiota bacterium]